MSANSWDIRVGWRYGDQVSRIERKGKTDRDSQRGAEGGTGYCDGWSPIGEQSNVSATVP